MSDERCATDGDSALTAFVRCVVRRFHARCSLRPIPRSSPIARRCVLTCPRDDAVMPSLKPEDHLIGLWFFLLTLCCCWIIAPLSEATAGSSMIALRQLYPHSTLPLAPQVGEWSAGDIRLKEVRLRHPLGGESARKECARPCPLDFNSVAPHLLLVTLGCYWLLLVVIGCYRLPLVVLGFDTDEDIRGIMEPFKPADVTSPRLRSSSSSSRGRFSSPLSPARRLRQRASDQHRSPIALPGASALVWCQMSCQRS